MFYKEPGLTTPFTGESVCGSDTAAPRARYSIRWSGSVASLPAPGRRLSSEFDPHRNYGCAQAGLQQATPLQPLAATAAGLAVAAHACGHEGRGVDTHPGPVGTWTATLCRGAGWATAGHGSAPAADPACKAHDSGCQPPPSCLPPTHRLRLREISVRNGRGRSTL